MNGSIPVALCAFNGARFVDQQMTRIFFQGRPPSEILIFDDGSSVGTPAVVRDLFGASPVVPLHQIDARAIANREPPGVPGGVGQVVSGCTGGLIEVCDLDRLWQASGVGVEKCDLALAVAAFERVRAGRPAARLRRHTSVLEKWGRGRNGGIACQGQLDVSGDLVQQK